MIEYCEDQGLRYTTRALNNGYHFLWVLQKVKVPDPNTGVEEIEEVEELMGISQPPAGFVDEARFFDIIDRIYELLIRKWKDWTLPVNNLLLLSVFVFA